MNATLLNPSQIVCVLGDAPKHKRHQQNSEVRGASFVYSRLLGTHTHICHSRGQVKLHVFFVLRVGGNTGTKKKIEKGDCAPHRRSPTHSPHTRATVHTCNRPDISTHQVRVTPSAHIELLPFVIMEWRKQAMSGKGHREGGGERYILPCTGVAEKGGAAAAAYE